jgi:hypothetical protein
MKLYLPRDFLVRILKEISLKKYDVYLIIQPIQIQLIIYDELSHPIVFRTEYHQVDSFNYYCFSITELAKYLKAEGLTGEDFTVEWLEPGVPSFCGLLKDSPEPFRLHPAFLDEDMFIHDNAVDLDATSKIENTFKLLSTVFHADENNLMRSIYATEHGTISSFDTDATLSIMGTNSLDAQMDTVNVFHSNVPFLKSVVYPFLRLAPVGIGMYFDQGICTLVVAFNLGNRNKKYSVTLLVFFPSLSDGVDAPWDHITLFDNKSKYDLALEFDIENELESGQTSILGTNTPSSFAISIPHYLYIKSLLKKSDRQGMTIQYNESYGLSLIKINSENYVLLSLLTRPAKYDKLKNIESPFESIRL